MRINLTCQTIENAEPSTHLLIAEVITVKSWIEMMVKSCKALVSGTHKLASDTGISLQTISKLRNGKICKPQRLTAELVAAELGVSPQDIWPHL